MSDGRVRTGRQQIRPHPDGAPGPFRLCARHFSAKRGAQPSERPHNLTPTLPVCGRRRRGSLLTKRHTRLRAVVAILTLLAVLVGAGLLSLTVLDTSLQSAFYDKAIDVSPAQVRNQITIVAIDDPSISYYGTYPLPHRAYTELLNKLKPLGPSVVAFDVAFYDPTSNPEEDRSFAAAIRESGNVLLAMQGAGDANLGDHIERFPALRLPVPILREAAAGVGAVNIFADPDGRVRDAQLVIQGPDGQTYYSLPLVSAAKKLRAELSQARREGDRLVVPAPPARTRWNSVSSR
ncbi:MAG: CHASE2 domain-containing protein [Chloroflexi bacterium]|nr:MAG: CHASE2 domain-containing protein [Chloroflexota bacterium]